MYESEYEASYLARPTSSKPRMHSELLLLCGADHSVLHKATSEGPRHALERNNLARDLVPELWALDNGEGIEHTHPDGVAPRVHGLGRPVLLLYVLCDIEE